MKKTFEISIPTEWNDITIETYIKYNDAVKDLEDGQEIMVKTISTMCGIDESIVEHMKLSDLQKIQESLQKLISKPVQKEIITKINIDGKIYGWHPKIDEMTMGEFVDIETFAKDNDIAKIMSVLYRPIVKTQGNRYDIEPYDADVHLENELQFKKLSINIGNPVAVFFWNLGNKQLNNFHQSSKRVEKELHQVDMDGLQQ